MDDVTFTLLSSPSTMVGLLEKRQNFELSMSTNFQSAMVEWVLTGNNTEEDPFEFEFHAITSDEESKFLRPFVVATVWVAGDDYGLIGPCLDRLFEESRFAGMARYGNVRLSTIGLVVFDGIGKLTFALTDEGQYVCCFDSFT